MKVSAPAKINLCLHVTGRRDDGYHILESLVVFVPDVADQITIEPSSEFEFSIDGPYGRGLDKQENLVVQAAQGIARLCDKPLACSIKLTKNLPVASGIGGGSADAAATVKGLLEFWNIKNISEGLPDFLLSLGADVPVCFNGQSVFMCGIGEVLKPVSVPQMHVLLVNNGQSCSTAQIFQKFNTSFSDLITCPPVFKNAETLVGFLQNCRNDLYLPACTYIPEIRIVLDELKQQTGCLFAQMSGSGATCFGLFTDRSVLNMARERLSRKYPDWWIQGGYISR